MALLRDNNSAALRGIHAPLSAAFFLPSTRNPGFSGLTLFSSMRFCMHGKNYPLILSALCAQG
jgi:hypothetical protein